ncbi:MAG: hypothetical protein ISS63_14910 [Desulfobacteraceae bacterium]|nr:hypothetical protein [Desulfobacteraceae bacterium]
MPILALLGALMLPLSLYADDAPLVLFGKGVRLIHGDGIRMVEERVSIVLQADNMGGFADVTAEFTFQNFGAAKTILMGFPKFELDEGYEWENFETLINGQELKVTVMEHEDDDYSQKKTFSCWYTWKVSFDEKEKKK